MPIQQASNGKTAEAIVVRGEKENKAGVTDVKVSSQEIEMIQLVNYMALLSL